MANRTFYPSFSYGFGRVYAECRFTFNGTSAPLASSVVGSDLLTTTTPISHSTTTQIYAINFKDSFYKVVYANLDILRTSGANTAGEYVSLQSVANEGTATPIVVTFYSWNASGTALNDIANTRDGVFSCALINSSSGMK